MSNILTIEGKEYTSATSAGKHFGYTKDYILMLIKAGHFDGQKVGNKWYVYLPSAEEYFSRVATERVAQRKRISTERKAELKFHTYKKHKAHVHAALLETLVIVFLGSILGVAGYIGTSTTQVASVSQQDVSSYIVLKNFAISLYDFISPRTIPASVVSTQVSADTTTTQGMVIAPESTFTATSADAVRNMFADEVQVVPDSEHADTGVVTPVFKNATDTESYRFLMVPVTQKHQ